MSQVIYGTVQETLILILFLILIVLSFVLCRMLSLRSSSVSAFESRPEVQPNWYFWEIERVLGDAEKHLNELSDRFDHCIQQMKPTENDLVTDSLENTDEAIAKGLDEYVRTKGEESEWLLQVSEIGFEKALSGFVRQLFEDSVVLETVEVNGKLQGYSSFFALRLVSEILNGLNSTAFSGQLVVKVDSGANELRVKIETSPVSIELDEIDAQLDLVRVMAKRTGGDFSLEQTERNKLKYTLSIFK